MNPARTFPEQDATDSMGEGVESPNVAGRRRLESRRGEPLFHADWNRAIFLHFAVDPGSLQPYVPFPLELREGRAWISLVAFTMHGMRFRFGGALGRIACASIATHPFLNVRTYVRLGDEPGIHFLVEWLPNRLATLLGPVLFGLPYRFGKLTYAHDTDAIQGNVEDEVGRCLRYRGVPEPDPAPVPCLPGSLDEFLLERYTAYVAWRGGRRGFFRIWHPPWPQTRVAINWEAHSLLEAVPGAAQWLPGAEFRFANASPGCRNVAMGRPHFLTGSHHPIP